MRHSLALVLLLLSPALLHAIDFKSFADRHCMDCHDNDTKKGDFSLEAMSTEITPANSHSWLKVLQQIERQNMPPADKEQPTAQDRRNAELELEGKLVAFAQKEPSHHATVLRRLNRTEYRQTVRDLLDLNMSSFDPGKDFPEDNRVEGFASNGEKLVTSSFLLRQYVEAADQIVQRAVHFEPRPEVHHWNLLPPFDRTSRGFGYAEAAYFQKTTHERPPYQSIVERMRDSPQMGYVPVDDLRAGVPESGWYHIRLHVEAKFRYADLDPKDPKLDLRKQRFPSLWDPTEPIRLALFTGTLEGIDPQNKEALDSAATLYQAGQRQLGVWDLPDEGPVWLDCRVWLDRGQFIRMGFPNGPSDGNNRVRNYFKFNADRLLNAEQRALYDKDNHNDWNVYMWFESPRIRVSNIDIEGPLNDTWPPQSHRDIFGDKSYQSQDADAVLAQFATRAWRRPVAPQETAPLLKLVRTAEHDGLSAQAAIEEGLKGILCSPEFLYREEKTVALNPYELASRLSYFLWSSMPDEKLQQCAASGDITKSKALGEQAERLLADPRSESFVEEFLNGWLALRKLGSMAPDIHKFTFYYDHDMEPAMRTETRLFFRQLLNTNGKIEHLLESDHSFINRSLAQLYHIDPELVSKAQGEPIEGLTAEDLAPPGAGHAPSLGFAWVKLPDAWRGGLLGQASILTLTANGVDTSPVIRGVWLLENILGARPDPPPPNVPTIEPDIRGAKTIRDQLQKHQLSANCKSCHHLIDPPGFALENFDAIGRWRGHYTSGKSPLPVDASGELGGVKFTDVRSFKQALLSHQEQFARCLVEKLLIHALGRELEITDRPEIRRIVEAAAPGGYRLRDLVLLCATSEIFRHK